MKWLRREKDSYGEENKERVRDEIKNIDED